MAKKFKMGKGLFSFTYEISEINEAFNDVSQSYKKAVSNTVNKVGRQANKAVSKHIKSNYNIPAKELKIGNLVRLTRSDARRNFYLFVITVFQSSRDLIKYNAKQLSTGVRVKVSKQAKMIKGAFISTWRKDGNNNYVFLRDPKRGYYFKGDTRREKRRVLFGPSIADLYRSFKAREIIDKVIDENFQKVLDEEFNKQFEKKRR